MRSVRPRTVCTLSAEEAAAMEFRVLGPVEGVRDGRVIRLDSPTQRALLALFVIHAGRTLSPDRILTEVWP
jgi:DNA-binding SARP family transcriptional activator